MIIIFCPKCGGGTFIADEELVKVLEDSRPLKAVIKLVYSCRACGDKFSRIVHEALENKKRDESGAGIQSGAGAASAVKPVSDVPEGLRFF